MQKERTAAWKVPCSTSGQAAEGTAMAVGRLRPTARKRSIAAEVRSERDQVPLVSPFFGVGKKHVNHPFQMEN